MNSPVRRIRHFGRRVLEEGGLRPKPGAISQANLRRFLRDAQRHPLPALPVEAPRSIAVVVPLFNHAAYLPATLESIANQTRRPDELIFVDDGSPDESRLIVEKFLADTARPGGRATLLVNERNLGQAASLNRGIEAATTDLIMILNDDDYLMHDVVETDLELFGRYREVALIGASAIHFSGNDVLAAAPKLINAGRRGNVELTIHRPEQVPSYRGYTDLTMTHSGSCFLKFAWKTVGGYRPKKDRCLPYADRDLQLRINALWPIAVAYATPFSLWRTDSSVDEGRES